MQFLTKVTVGETEIQISGNVESQQKLVEDLAFFSSLPSVGPNGETDLKFQYRKTKEGYEYYSIVSDKAGMEYKFGQSKDKPGTLFGKGWEPKYQTEGNDQAVDTSGVTGFQAPQASSNNVNMSPTPTPAPAPAPAQVAPSPAPANTQAAPANNQQASANILSQFGIN